jgi:hypothetical protein
MNTFLIYNFQGAKISYNPCTTDTEIALVRVNKKRSEEVSHPASM